MIGRAKVLGLTLVLALTFGATASADTPVNALTTAMQKTASAKTAHVQLAQRYSGSGRTTTSNVTGTLARGDQDLTTSSEGAESRRVAVGQNVYQRRPNTPGAPWKTTPRSVPASDQAFGSLTLPDGTSLGDPKLYRNVLDVGIEQLAQGPARKITADVDMSAVAAALQLPAGDRSRLGRMQASVTLWVSTTDGSLLRHSLTITIPGASGTQTIETTIDLSDLDAALTIAAP